MKKKLIVLFTALMLFSGVTFATDDVQPSEALQKEFNKEFAGSTEVKWEKVADYYKASFLQNDQYLIVYFDEFNNIESISRELSTKMLPLILQKDLKDKLAESLWITDCFELFGDNGTEYYVVLENADQKTFYQAVDNSWEIYKRTDK
jgi:hypothetical protein